MQDLTVQYTAHFQKKEQIGYSISLECITGAVYGLLTVEEVHQPLKSLAHAKAP